MTAPPQRVIGGVFGWPADPTTVGPSTCPFLHGGELLLANGRCGIAVAVEHLKPGQVWLPSYICPSLLVAVNSPGTFVRFYEVDDRLRIASTEWLGDVRQGDLVLFIDYFGIRFDQEFARLVSQRGALVMEDACQALLTDGVGTGADLTLFSPRKFIGVPDGGVLAASPELGLTNITLNETPPGWWLGALTAVLRRAEFDRHGGDRKWFDLFQRAERDAPVGSYSMSQLTRTVLERSFDYADIARRRLDNYGRLAARLRDVALFPELPAGAVPLGFPIRVKSRDQVSQRLFEKLAFPPVHWRLEGAIPSTFLRSYELSEEILTLPCDQRYDTPDTDLLSAIVLASI